MISWRFLWKMIQLWHDRVFCFSLCWFSNFWYKDILHFSSLAKVSFFFSCFDILLILLASLKCCFELFLSYFFSLLLLQSILDFLIPQRDLILFQSWRRTMLPSWCSRFEYSKLIELWITILLNLIEFCWCNALNIVSNFDLLFLFVRLFKNETLSTFWAWYLTLTTTFFNNWR